MIGLQPREVGLAALQIEAERRPSSGRFRVEIIGAPARAGNAGLASSRAAVVAADKTDFDVGNWTLYADFHLRSGGS